MTEFELSPEIVDQLMYAMENQNESYAFDAAEGVLVSGNQTEETDEDRFLEIPSWKSSDGFMLMEKFTGTLRNPMIRENLRAILSGGKGVFRGFKQELKNHAELERLWFNFKEREMRNRIHHWYNDLRELWGLERIGIEIDDTDELILSDFEISEDDSGFEELISILDKKAFYEIFSEYPAGLAEYFYSMARSDSDTKTQLPCCRITARAPDGSLAGFVWVRQIDLVPVPGDSLQRPSTAFDLVQLYILPAFRGLGLASLLLDKAADYAYSKEADWLFMNMFLYNKELEHGLLSKGFEPAGTVYKLSVRKWGDS